MGAVGRDTRFAIICGSAGDAGVCERGISDAAAGSVFLFVPEAIVCEPMAVGGILGRADHRDGVCALSFWQDGIRPGTFDSTDPAVGSGCVRRAESGVHGGRASGAAPELLETGNGDGPATLPGAGVWCAGGDGVLSAASDRHSTDQSEPVVLSILRFAVRIYGLHGGDADISDVVRVRDSEATVVRCAGNHPARGAVCAGAASPGGDSGGGDWAAGGDRGRPGKAAALFGAEDACGELCGDRRACSFGIDAEAEMAVGVGPEIFQR